MWAWGRGWLGGGLVIGDGDECTMKLWRRSDAETLSSKL
jgi:hypothetical protein